MVNLSEEYDPNGTTPVTDDVVIEIDENPDAYDWPWIAEHIMHPDQPSEEVNMSKGSGVNFIRYLHEKGMDMPFVELGEKQFTVSEAKEIGDQLGVDWKKIDKNEFTRGLSVELEHKDVTGGDLVATGKIALAHLKELPDYYTRLAQMEEEPIKKFIVRRNGKWCVTEDNNGKPGKTIGTHDTRAEAVAQLRAIEANKHKH